MEDADKKLKALLAQALDRKQPSSGQTCPDSGTLSEYVLGGGLDTERKQRLEAHIADCKACLERVSGALKADTMLKEDLLPAASHYSVKKTTAAMFPNRKKTRFVWPLLTAAAFVSSFAFPKYFMQCLAAAVIFALKWVVESENMRTLILVLDSWRRRQHTRDDEIAGRLADRDKMINCK